MGRLIVSAQMTMDSVMDHIEDWFDPEFEDPDGVAQLRAADALVLGRVTYEHFAEYWPSQHGAYAELVNPIPKYVVSSTLTEPLAWNSQLLGADFATEVAALKARYSGDLICYGCGKLANHLARHGLIDEVRFWLYPVVWGDGVRPFHAGQLPIRMRLLSATPYTSGVVKLSYQPLSHS
ncbi:dihydrofolate reductase family protein [Mycolicibacterium hodleri]|uniref:Deaminase n=1 Tax=Mycolicibacterium hodleri TaxID=49897 RepID=A0A502DJ74_9MYCO|nr:dihydrofolate reductase family protein [Mycolicibacterium hodleri]TPG25567.1 deaminase [Mycolicibacterium hodleri]